MEPSTNPASQSELRTPEEGSVQEAGGLEIFTNRETSWLAFARRVLAQAESPELPLLERIRFAGIVGMLHDEFTMKRVSGLKRKIATGSGKILPGGMTSEELLTACRAEMLAQTEALSRVLREDLLPALDEAGIPIRNHKDLTEKQQRLLRDYCQKSVLPILTPLAVDAEHPFPFISNLGLNLAVMLPANGSNRDRFVRVKVPGNRPRWVPIPGEAGFTPLEQVIAANLDLMFSEEPRSVHSFRVTRGVEGTAKQDTELSVEDAYRLPGGIVRQVSRELKARRFAGAIRLETSDRMPDEQRRWLATQLEIELEDVNITTGFLAMNHLLQLEENERSDLCYPRHEPVTHPRLRRMDPADPGAVFREIARGDILLHHPYDSFDTSVLRLLQSAATDPDVLAIKLTIYRTSRDSPTVRALAEAARQGKQVAVLVEITARFDEAPNIAWGRFLEKEGVHVSYGVERLKTHVKLALVVRDEKGTLRRYAHVGTGNYHSGTARIYEDLGVLTCEPEICADVAAVFNTLTGSTPYRNYNRMLVAPVTMREHFAERIQREAKHARAGRPCGIIAKMNQLQDLGIIRELYDASQAGVPIILNVRGLCCLRPGVPGLSEGIRVHGVVGRFLEHSRIYRFENGGEPEYFIGSADWMKRNLDRRVETIIPVLDEAVQRELDEILDVYERDNATVWDCDSEGEYHRRTPADGEERRAAQEIFARRAQQ